MKGFKKQPLFSSKTESFFDFVPKIRHKFPSPL